jgi:hypothetical protein
MPLMIIVYKLHNLKISVSKTKSMQIAPAELMAQQDTPFDLQL